MTPRPHGRTPGPTGARRGRAADACRRLGAVLAAALVLAGGAAGPAAAHSDEAPGGSDVRVAVLAVTPALPGVTVTAIEAGARLQLTNRGPATVEVRGEAGEPYLQVRPDGAYENSRSPSTYRNRTLAGAPVPAEADPGAAPQWRRVSPRPVARWHEPRATWPADLPRAGPARAWSVPVAAVGGTAAAGTVASVTGTVTPQVPPTAPLWWLLTLVGVGLVALLGLTGAPGTTGARRWYGRLGTVTLAVLSAGAGCGALAYAVARERDAGAATVGELALALAQAQVWPVLTALGGIAAGGYALLRRPAADFALALAGACVGLFPGIANAAVFARAVPPATWGGPAARVAVAAVTAVGLGLALAGALRLRTAIAAAPPRAAQSRKP
ncbi:hypothetical protein GCM10010124_05770 [Pilimelia terevasa]|uniref:Uncharacterized protein n=1 Tax=Pilimelia terevasa TaxID=53372 RepID=A0A8J3FEZ5_9ACTN|nr:hypothetical protein [Pilimelia terevasa]GGK15989.1 hypothetical protein GCM10010124_05770 [Pilimelia terevasa]